MTNNNQTFELETTRRNLIAMRQFFGADTPEGHRCSNIVELLENREGATVGHLAEIDKNIAEQISDLEKLKAQRVQR